jgi:hypothetical protein
MKLFNIGTKLFAVTQMICSIQTKKGQSNHFSDAKTIKRIKMKKK